MKRETKTSPLRFVGWYIFVFTHKRSSAEIHRVFLFPRIIEHLSRLPTLMRSKHLAALVRHQSGATPFFGHSEVLRQIWRRGVGLNMYWLWIKEHGQWWIKYVLIVNRSQMSWSWVPSRQRRPCWGRILTRWRRDRVRGHLGVFGRHGLALSSSQTNEME